MGDRFAGLNQIAGVERVGDIRDMGIKTALGDERAAGDAGKDQAEGQQEQRGLDRKGDGADNEQQQEQRDGARSAAALGLGAVVVEARVEKADEAAHPGDRMAYTFGNPIRIAGNELDQQSEKR